MSVQNVKDFFAKVKSDPALTQKAKEIGAGNYKATEAFAASLGYTFTDEDMLAYYKEILPSSSELDESELSGVAGGTATTTAGMVGDSAQVPVTATAGGW
jgi:predicted ribosomally synthesized peptide with nif11-like leader